MRSLIAIATAAMFVAVAGGMNSLAYVARQSAATSSAWHEQQSGTTARLRGLSAVNQKVVWASGSGGTVLRTIDGGDQWKNVSVKDAATLDFRDVHGVNANTAYVLSIGDGEKSRIYKTSDGGMTWKLQFTNGNSKAFFDGFAFWDANHGIAFSDPVDGRFLILTTVNGGTTWREIPRDNMPAAQPDEAAFAASGSSIAVAAPDHVWIATGGSVARVLHSSDRGVHWTASNTPIVSGTASSGIFSICAASAETIFIVGGDYQKENESNMNFAKSDDGGRTWTAGPSLPGYRSAIQMATGHPDFTQIAVGPSGSNFMPLIGSWRIAGTVGYDALSFVRGTAVGWASGANGRIARWVH